MQADSYRLGSRLGSGGMSLVYEAEHQSRGRVVALKLLRPELCECEDVVTRFLSEARFLRALTGRHIVRMLDAGCLESGVPFLELERLAGSDLAAVIKACGRLAAPIAVDYALDACAGLAEAHARGIIHCDVKPANLFLAAAPLGRARIKVLDFGIAEWLERTPSRSEAAARPMSLMGSPAYCSPEQFDHCEPLDPRTDIWSLGLVLFEMLSGICPFSETTLAAIRARLQRPAPGLRGLCPDIDPGLAAVVASCLQKDRERRFASMQELADALRPFASERLPPRARATPPFRARVDYPLPRDSRAFHRDRDALTRRYHAH